MFMGYFLGKFISWIVLLSDATCFNNYNTPTKRVNKLEDSTTRNKSEPNIPVATIGV